MKMINIVESKSSALAVLNLFPETGELSFLDVVQMFCKKIGRDSTSDIAEQLNGLLDIGLLSVSEGRYSITESGLSGRKLLESLQRVAKIPTGKLRRYSYSLLEEEHLRKPRRGTKEPWKDITQGRD